MKISACSLRWFRTAAGAVLLGINDVDDESRPKWTMIVRYITRFCLTSLKWAQYTSLMDYPWPGVRRSTRHIIPDSAANKKAHQADWLWRAASIPVVTVLLFSHLYQNICTFKLYFMTYVLYIGLYTCTSLMLNISETIHCVSKNWYPLCFCNNLVECRPIILGRVTPE